MVKTGLRPQNKQTRNMHSV